MHLHPYPAAGVAVSPITTVYHGDDGSTLTFTAYPQCPQCGADWEDDHRDGGHCPGKPQGCTCRHSLQQHNRISGCWQRKGPYCPCVYGRRPTDYSGEDWKNRGDED